MRSAAMRRSAAFLFVAVRCSRVPVFVPPLELRSDRDRGPERRSDLQGNLGIGNGSETL